MRHHYFISGTVQGVYFRESTKRLADSLGLRGWVKNLPDGRVEAVIEGDQQAMREMHKWIGNGPSAAIVEKLKATSEEPQNEMGSFRVLR